MCVRAGPFVSNFGFPHNSSKTFPWSAYSLPVVRTPLLRHQDSLMMNNPCSPPHPHKPVSRCVTPSALEERSIVQCGRKEAQTDGGKVNTRAALCSRVNDPCGLIKPPHSNRQNDSKHGMNKHSTPTSGVTWGKRGEGEPKTREKKSKVSAEESDD